MNGDERVEAPRPRPLSAGIWTLFSWLRRSERSSSSESISSVGSARTAVSFDFLAPGNCNFTNTPIVLTTPLNPPTETYKKRLQERNLRRQRDRDVTLHRKYGLFREYGNVYDEFTLPPARRTLGNSVDRSNRERRAASECLQRRAAYVPGKRRAPLPPATATSASLPRTYKRKRPAPKPPLKNTLIINKDNNIVQLINNPIRMSSNSESEEKYVPDNELLSSDKTQKCDKKVTNPRSTKSKTDKNFLKHIFENRKRSSVIETTSVRLLPSISELDKQANEIIENHKLRHNRNSVNNDDFNNSQDNNGLYEGNMWFCTTCLRKYNSSIDSCNYCLPDKGLSTKKDGLKVSSPRSSIYTQTNINKESATSSRNSMDERKMLKEILKEMKDSLPKKNKNNKINEVITESPTLRIGSTMQEAFKDFSSQPSSSSEFLHNNRILSISSLLSETQSNYNQKNITDQHVLKSPDKKNLSQQKSAVEFEKKSNIQSTSVNIPVKTLEHSLNAKGEHIEKNKNDNHSPVLFSNMTKKYNTQEINSTKVTENKKRDNNDLNISDNFTNVSQIKPPLTLISTKTNDSKEIGKSNLKVLPETSNNTLGDRHHFLKDQINLDNVNTQNKVSLTSTSPCSSTSNNADKASQKSSKLKFLNFPNSRAVVVNTVTVITSHSNNKSPGTSNILSAQNTENNSIQSNKSTVYKAKNISDIPFQIESSSAKINKSLDNQTYLGTNANLLQSSETLIDNVKPENNLNRPLNISSLLNPLYSPSMTIIKENTTTSVNASNPSAKDIHSNFDAININKTDSNVNKEVIKNNTPQLDFTASSALQTAHQGKDLAEPHTKDVKIEPRFKNVILKDVLNEEKALPSTSGCYNIVPMNSNDNVNNYDQRRHLINQLEQSIAKGDEVAAADAAVKLAKLRLSCSVLSFSSQIVGENSGVKQNENTKATNHITITKEKPIEAKISQRLTAEAIDTSTQETNNEPINKIAETKVVPELVKNNVQPQLLNNEPSSSKQVMSEDTVPINVWIEDKQAARGPIRLNISRLATMFDLRRQAEKSLGLATQLQRWIVGRTLCSDDETPIVSLAGPYFRAPFYLCIVQPDENNKPVENELNSEVKENRNGNATEPNGEFYTELMKLEKQSLVPNIEPFECGVCMDECAAGAGVILRECIHTFCRDCLSDVVQHSQEPAVACPAMGCAGFLQEREIRTIVTSEEYERWLARGLATAECGTRNAFHCRTRDCAGWAFCDPGVRRFPCPVCKKTNCVQCQAIHEGETCEQYQSKLREAVTAAETNKDDEGTQAFLNSLISRGEALECPECKAIITKKWGCDWVKCSACKTEICWVTKGRRWGPGGRGDTSGGCRCGVDGQRCHPSCGYCH